MTLINQNSTITHNGNGTTTEWPYDFIIPDDESARVGLFDIATSALTELDSTAYSISGIGDSAGGEVVYPLVGAPIGADKRLVIWRQVDYTQDTELTNQTPYYPVVLMEQLDRIVMQTQQLAAEVDRSLKVTLGSTLDPDAFIAQLQQGAADAAASADEAEASAIAAANSAASIDPTNLVHYNQVDGQSVARRGQARANIGADVLGGFRNKLINGDFTINQRGNGTYTTAGFGLDRWRTYTSGSASITVQPKAYDPGAIPALGKGGVGVDLSMAGAGAKLFSQPIEDVTTLAGCRATLTFWVYSPTIGIPLNPAVVQEFGAGGSADYVVPTVSRDATTNGGWKKCTLVVDIPSVAGKTLGANHRLTVYPIALYETVSLYLALFRVSLVEGDATAEADPFSPRHIQQELALCQRYYLKHGVDRSPSNANGHGQILFYYPVQMRGAPTVSHNIGAGLSPVVTSRVNRVFITLQSLGVSVAGVADAYTIELDAEL